MSASGGWSFIHAVVDYVSVILVRNKINVS